MPPEAAPEASPPPQPENQPGPGQPQPDSSAAGAPTQSDSQPPQLSGTPKPGNPGQPQGGAPSGMPKPGGDDLQKQSGSKAGGQPQPSGSPTPGGPGQEQTSNQPGPGNSSSNQASQRKGMSPTNNPDNPSSVRNTQSGGVKSPVPAQSNQTGEGSGLGQKQGLGQGKDGGLNSANPNGTAPPARNANAPDSQPSGQPPQSGRSGDGAIKGGQPKGNEGTNPPPSDQTGPQKRSNNPSAVGGREHKESSDQATNPQGAPTGPKESATGSKTGKPNGQGSSQGQSGAGSAGGAGRNPAGGGGGRNPADAGGPPPPDDSKPLPHAPTPPENGADNVAPKNQEKTGLTLRQVRDLLKNDQVTPELLNDLGMSKEELNQFVSKFEKAPKGEPGAGRDIEAKPGKPQTVDPNRTLPDLNPATRIDSATVRDRGAIVDDNLRGNMEGARFVPPPEIRSRFEVYKKSLARPRGTSNRRAAEAPGRDAGSGGR